MTSPPARVGRYHIERLIAHGGMGSLYLARDPAIDRLVVIKLLKEGFDDEGRERFLREARAAGRLHHPNIVTVFDVGEDAGRPFIAMEYVQGETLAHIIKRRARAHVWEKLALVEVLCAGLHFAHAAGVVHRDIKPSNVMREQTGTLKILDFGIARAGGGSVTRTGDVVGTLNYMSPEQLAGESVDHRTDIYSVGALAYELITGQMAFPGTIQTGVLYKILNSRPVPMESLVPDLDPDVTAMVARAMARDLGARYQDLDSLGQDLAVVRARLLESAPDLVEPEGGDAETRVESGRLVQSAPSHPSSRRLASGRRSDSALFPKATVEPPPPRRRAVVVSVGSGIVVGLVVLLLAFRSPPETPIRSDDEVRERTNETAIASLPPPTTVPSPPPTVTSTTEVPVAARDESLRAVRRLVRDRLAVNDRQGALAAISSGFAIDSRDPELHQEVANLLRNARREVGDARTAAARLAPAGAATSVFKQGQTLERQAELSVRGADPLTGIRTLWAASTLYASAADLARREKATPSGTATAVTPGGVAVEPSLTPPSDPPLVSTPPAPARTPAPATTDKPSSPVAPPSGDPDARPPVGRERVEDPRESDLSAIRDTLRRYSDAYASLDSANVGKVMPTLTRDQLRALERDFSNYRRYTAQISGERIAVSGEAATVSCQVTRSFETKNGVSGSNTIESVFHLRRSAAGWVIERLEGR